MAKKASQFKITEETRKRCKIITVSSSNKSTFLPVSIELFHFLYEVKRINFSIYFRVENQIIEYMRPEEFSEELLDNMHAALKRYVDEIEVCVLKGDGPKLNLLLEEVRDKKIKNLVELNPGLDKNVLHVFSQLSTASQMVVRGGINQDVASSVSASAALLVSNILDSEALVSTMSKMILCDPTLYDHSASVAMFASVIASRHLKKPMSSKEVEVIAQSGLYHDVGKSCVPQEILNKPGKFTPAEFEVMKTHTSEGYKVLCGLQKSVPAIDDMICRVALEHHEKFQGGGYPKNKKGRLEENADNGIHLYARIVAIADVYSALLMKRVYKESYEPRAAVNIMLENQRDFDPDILMKFVKGVTQSINQYEKKHGNAITRAFVFNEDGSIDEKKAS